MVYSQAKVSNDSTSTSIGHFQYILDMFLAPKWNQHRKLINPSFRLPVLRTFFPIFNRNSRQFTDSLETLVGTGPHNLSDILQKLTLSTAMGKVNIL